MFYAFIQVIQREMLSYQREQVEISTARKISSLSTFRSQATNSVMKQVKEKMQEAMTNI